MKLTNDELRKLISEKVYSIYDKNSNELGDKAVLPAMIMQMSVYATLQVLEELDLLKLPTKSE